MSHFLAWIQRRLLGDASRAAPPRRPRPDRRVRLWLEPLEARCVPSATLIHLADFAGDNAANPNGGLVADASGDLFGTTASGGPNMDGTVFEWVKSSGTISILGEIVTLNGGHANGGLVQDPNGDLFGTTDLGASSNDSGTIFEWVKSTGTLTSLASTNDFSLLNMGAPQGGLTQDSGGDLFGTTSGTQVDSAGMVFELIKSTGTLKSLTDLSSINASSPNGGMAVDASGNLFGTTAGGGANGFGTVFELIKATNTLSILGSFNGMNGIGPKGGLVEDSSGNLFGTTNTGGTNNDGTVFEWVNSSRTITVLANLSAATGSNPQGNLIEDSSGNLFGAASNGGTGGHGTVFEWVRSTGTISVLANFAGSNGSGANGGLAEDSSNNLFGTTMSGGAANAGTVFQVAMPRPQHFVVTAQDAGGQPKVQVFDPNSGAGIDAFLAYPLGLTAGVRVAVGDLQGNGSPEILATPGPGGGSFVRVFSITGQMLGQFVAFADAHGNPFTGGQFIAAADILGQGYDDIIVSADTGGGPAVAVFDGKTFQQVLVFFAFPTAKSGAVFTGGVRVAAGPYTPGGPAVIFTAAGPGGGPAVSVWSAADIAANKPEKTFFVLPADAKGHLFTGGVYLGVVAAGDGRDFLVTGAAPGGGPAVTLIDPLNTPATSAFGLLVGQPFDALDPSFTGGVRVAGGAGEVVVVPGPGGGAFARIFDQSGSLLQTLNTSDPDNPLSVGGLYVAAT